jgi:hypothetical protein
LIYYFTAQETAANGMTSYTCAYYLTKITSKQTNKSIEFKYKSGSMYHQYHTTGLVGYGMEYRVDDTDFSLREDGYNLEKHYIYSNTSCEPLLLDSVKWDGNSIHLEYKTDRADLYKDRLCSLKISNETKQVRKVTFDNNGYFGSNAANFRMKLNGIAIHGNINNLPIQQYTFEYNTTALPAYSKGPSGNNDVASTNKTDYWGYYNGKDYHNSYGIPFEYIPSNFPNDNRLGIDRTPNESLMQACILTKIHYPTGGTTKFEYEANRSDSTTIIGGLRIKSIRSIADNGKEILKTYEYAGCKSAIIYPDMFRYDRPRVYTSFTSYNAYNTRSGFWRNVDIKYTT